MRLNNEENLDDYPNLREKPKNDISKMEVEFIRLSPEKVRQIKQALVEQARITNAVQLRRKGICNGKLEPEVKEGLLNLAKITMELRKALNKRCENDGNK